MLGVVYLARAAEPTDSIQRFADSYRRHPAGIAHTLIVIFKGFNTYINPSPYVAAFAGLQYKSFWTTDTKVDIGNYQDVAQHYGSDATLCFLNTHSEILADNWLRIMYDALMPEVGVVGTTATYESLRTSSELISKAVWLTEGMGVKRNRWLKHQFSSELTKNAPTWMKRYRAASVFSKIKMWRRPKIQHELHEGFTEFWHSLTAIGGPYYFLREWRAFPNPHIRSNAFLIRADTFRALRNYVVTKEHAYAFESGPNNMTGQIIRSGQRAVVVDRDGEVFEIDEWPKSGTFRSGNQSGLLVHDKQTRNFMRFNSCERTTLQRMTWGDYYDSAPYWYVDLGYPFARADREAMAKLAG